VRPSPARLRELEDDGTVAEQRGQLRWVARIDRVSLLDDVTTMWPQNSLVALDCEARIPTARSRFQRSEMPSSCPRYPLPCLAGGRTMKWSGGAVETLPHLSRRQIMYARSTTIQGQPSSIDAGIAHTRDSVMPALEGIDGCVGLSLLVDRTSGRCIVTSSWESEEAMRASEESVRPIRDQAAELLGGSRQVEEWEIAAMHREHRAGEGACVRATWVKVDPDQLDRGVDFYKTTILPALEGLEGFCSASLLVDRASGRGVASATFDNAEAIERNKDALDTIKTTGSQEANAEVLDQCDFELAVAHLRVPEMA
jgi:quinol monooxygenase YgiN